MLKIGEVLPPRPTPLWRLAKQCGVDDVVGQMDFSRGLDAPADDLPWSFGSLLRHEDSATRTPASRCR